MKNFFTNKENWGFIICGILLFVVFFLQHKNQQIDSQLKDIKKSEKKLETRIDSLKIIGDKIRREKDSLSREILITRQEIIEIQNKRDEKIILVDKYSVSDLQRFFTDRYK